jgi:hypothetical protein
LRALAAPVGEEHPEAVVQQAYVCGVYESQPEKSLPFKTEEEVAELIAA